MKHKVAIFLIMLSVFSLSANPFNKKLNFEEINDGEIHVRNIGNKNNISLNKKYNAECEEVVNLINKLDPKYLAEIIQIRPYKENENLIENIYSVLMKLEDYTNIPYYSVKAQQWYKLYDDTKILKDETKDGIQTLTVDFTMEPFGIINQTINIKKNSDYLIYTTNNNNKLRYYDKFDCVYANKMKTAIFVFREDDYWILYGIGGVNAPLIPFFSERIETSFMNRINTFCSYIFEKIK